MKLWSMVLALAFALSFAGMAGAQEAKKERKKKAGEAGMAGAVSSVDAGGNVKVKKRVAKKDAGAEAQEVSIATDEKTVVTIDGKAAKVSDLVVGMQVRVTPTTGKAEKIEARTGAKKNGGNKGAALTPEQKAKRQAAREARQAKKQAK